MYTKSENASQLDRIIYVLVINTLAHEKFYQANVEYSDVNHQTNQVETHS